MPDPITLAVATALAVKAAESAVGGLPAAWSSLVSVVRRRFRAEPEALQVLETAQARPDDEKSVAALANTLDRISRQDRAFDAELRTLWAQVSHTQTEQSAVFNQNSGAVTGSLLQGRDFTLTGDLNFGGPAEER